MITRTVFSVSGSLLIAVIPLYLGREPFCFFTSYKNTVCTKNSSVCCM